MEEKAPNIKNPSNYLKSAARREGYESVENLASSGPSSDDYSRVHKRITWMNTNLFNDRQIDTEIIAAVASLGTQRAFEMLKEMEGKSDSIKNPGAYLTAAVGRDLQAFPAEQHAPAFTSYGAHADTAKVRKRASWLNSNVFVGREIDEEAVAAMASLSTSRAMELFKEVEEKSEDIRNSGGYLKTAVRREGTAGASQTTPAKRPLSHGPAPAGKRIRAWKP